MVEDSRDPPAFFPDEFEEYASLFLERQFGFTRSDITHANGKNVFITLANSIVF